jgi:hypothetical protein
MTKIQFCCFYLYQIVEQPGNIKGLYFIFLLLIFSLLVLFIAWRDF